MCSSPNMPATPPPAQDAKEPDNLQARRKARPAGMGGNGTVLTGASGVTPGSLNTGGSTLLGG
jgi:hypothetical protein